MDLQTFILPLLAVCVTVTSGHHIAPYQCFLRIQSWPVNNHQGHSPATEWERHMVYSCLSACLYQSDCSAVVCYGAGTHCVAVSGYGNWKEVHSSDTTDVYIKRGDATTLPLCQQVSQKTYMSTPLPATGSTKSGGSGGNNGLHGTDTYMEAHGHSRLPEPSASQPWWSWMWDHIASWGQQTHSYDANTGRYSYVGTYEGHRGHVKVIGGHGDADSKNEVTTMDGDSKNTTASYINITTDSTTVDVRNTRSDDDKDGQDQTTERNEGSTDTSLMTSLSEEHTTMSEYLSNGHSTSKSESLASVDTQSPQSITDSQRLKTTHMDDQTTSGVVDTSCETVVFSATLTKTFNVTSPQETKVIVFDRPTINIGNNYRPALGAFISPSNGLYLFTVDIVSPAGTLASVQVVKNGQVLHKVRANGRNTNDYGSTSGTVATKLTPSDVVFVCLVYDEGPTHVLPWFTRFTGYQLSC